MFNTCWSLLSFTCEALGAVSGTSGHPSSVLSVFTILSLGFIGQSPSCRALTLLYFWAVFPGPPREVLGETELPCGLLWPVCELSRLGLSMPQEGLLICGSKAVAAGSGRTAKNMASTLLEGLWGAGGQEVGRSGVVHGQGLVPGISSDTHPLVNCEKETM